MQAFAKAVKSLSKILPKRVPNQRQIYCSRSPGIVEVYTGYLYGAARTDVPFTGIVEADEINKALKTMGNSEFDVTEKDRSVVFSSPTAKVEIPKDNDENLPLIEHSDELLGEWIANTKPEGLTQIGGNNLWQKLMLCRETAQDAVVVGTTILGIDGISCTFIQNGERNDDTDLVVIDTDTLDAVQAVGGNVELISFDRDTSALVFNFKLECAEKTVDGYIMGRLADYPRLTGFYNDRLPEFIDAVAKNKKPLLRFSEEWKRVFTNAKMFTGIDETLVLESRPDKKLVVKNVAYENELYYEETTGTCDAENLRLCVSPKLLARLLKLSTEIVHSTHFNVPVLSTTKDGVSRIICCKANENE